MIAKIALGVVALVAAILVLAALVAFRPDIPRAEIVAEYRAPDSTFVKLDDGSEIHVRDSGPKDAPALLLMHGVGSSAYAWDGWAAALSDKYRVLRMDLPGHGLTMVRSVPGGIVDQEALIDAVLDKLGIETVIIGGNSLGGGVAWRYAAERPDRVRGLIVVDSGGGGPPNAGQRGRGGPRRFAMIPGAQVAFRWGSGSLVWRYALESGVADKSLITDAQVRRADRLWRAEGNRETMLKRMAGGFAAAPADPKTIRVPTLVLQGEKDEFVSPASSKALADAIPGARYILYPGLGHTPHEEAPAQTAADVRAFLDETRR